MPTEPLQPFAPPAQVLSHLPLGAISGGVILEWILLAVFMFWAVYTLVIVYHWLKYSHASSVSFPAIVVHLVISIALISYGLTGVVPGWL